MLFFHTLAIIHSPAYRTENGGALRQDWPRIPLPATLDLLNASATLGRHVAALLDTQTNVPSVTKAPVQGDLKPVAKLSRTGSGGLQDGDLAISAGWGNPTTTDVMPGKGKLDTNPDGALGIYLNPHVPWRSIAASTWRYTISGYQVLKKWLSYRDSKVLHRALTLEEARDFQNTARRITALLSLTPELDTNYEAVKTGAVAL